MIFLHTKRKRRQSESGSMRVLRLIFLFFVLLSFNPPSSLSADPVVVIVSLQNPVNEITQERLQEAYLTEGKKWADGSTIVPLNLIQSHPASILFRERVLKKTAADLNVFWIQQVFSWKGSPPIILKEDQEVKAYISSHKEAIGYIRSSALDSTVKSIRVDGKAFIQ